MSSGIISLCHVYAPDLHTRFPSEQSKEDVLMLPGTELDSHQALARTTPREHSMATSCLHTWRGLWPTSCSSVSENLVINMWQGETTMWENMELTSLIFGEYFFSHATLYDFCIKSKMAFILSIAVSE